MDWVETVPLIAVVVWMLVSRWVRSRRRSKASPGGQPIDAGRPSIKQSLRDLLREIQQGMLVEAPPEPQPARRPRPVPVEPELSDEPPPPPPVLVASKPRRRLRRPALARSLLDDLRSGPTSLARAMLLIEVLGPPVALRDPRSGSRLR